MGGLRQLGGLAALMVNDDPDGGHGQVPAIDSTTASMSAASAPAHREFTA
jgi:hypothetical protein